MGLIDFPARPRRHDRPLVVFAGLQVEYISSGRAHYLPDAEARLPALQFLMDRARLWRLPIAHFRLLKDDFFFHPQSKFSNWIDGFEPRANELVFDLACPSCFSNNTFRKMMKGVANPAVVLAGFSGEKTCLSTAIDAFHLGCEVTYVTDCSATTPFGGNDGLLSHDSVCELIALYVETATAESVTSRIAGNTGRSANK